MNRECSSLRQSQRNRRKRCHARWIKSRGAILVIMWSYLAVSFINLVYVSITTSSKSDSTLTPAFCIIAALSPIAGFTAGVRFGTYRVMRVGMWLMWTGGILIVVYFIQQGLIHEFTTVGLLIATIPSIIGYVAFSVNSLTLVLDQMPDASGEQITAFIHWFVWSFVAGLATSELGKSLSGCIGHVQISNTDTVLSFLSVVLASVVLGCDFFCHQWLIIEPESSNPIRTIFGILKFAAKHKQPVRRSAFTFCEDKKPSRLDLAKSKYGGPFTMEQVEDVKTCIRMTLVIVSLCLFTIPSITFYNSLKEGYRSEFRQSAGVSQCYVSLTGFAKHWTTLGSLSIVIYESVIYPLARKKIPSTLKRIGVALSLVAIANAAMLVSSVIWYQLTDSGQCMFTADRDSPLQVNSDWVEVPVSFLFSTASVSLLAGLFEFVCAQTPYNLRGLLFGMVYSAIIASAPLANGVYIAWKKAYQNEGLQSPTCNVWFYLFTTITATLGCVLWCAVAKWYKRRERDEPDMCRIFAENYYAVN